jgi:hypothetical protein
LELSTSPSSPVSEQVATRLAPYIGAFNAQMWIKSVARRDLGIGPEELTGIHVARLLEGLRPFLQTLMGRGTADDLLAQIGREVH